MKKILFLIIALFSYSTIIYASFPVIENNTEITTNSNQPTSQSDKGTMMVLCALGFVGVAGLHRFMKGDTLGGLLMLLTFGGCGIWTLIDLIKIAGDNFR
tara:strand:+ start:67 stop:366 length:300 start_codon:yes stop_codon:yes gene_type:complete